MFSGALAELLAFAFGAAALDPCGAAALSPADAGVARRGVLAWGWSSWKSLAESLLWRGTGCTFEIDPSCE